MPEYLSPGVYVEEVDKGSKPIEAAGTSVAAFVGLTEKVPDGYKGEPLFLPNFTEFTTNFGGFVKGAYLPNAVYGYFMNGGGRCYVSSLTPPQAAGGGAKAVAALPSAAQPAIESLSISAIEGGEAGKDITVEIVKPTGEGVPDDAFNVIVHKGSTEEKFENVTFRRGRNIRNVVDVVNKDSKLIQVAEKESTLAAPEKMPKAGTYPLAVAEAKTTALTKISTDMVIGSAAERTGIMGLEVAEDVTMVTAPDIWSAYQAGNINMDQVKAIQLGMIAHCEAMKDRFAIIDCPPEMSPQKIKDWRMKEAGYDTKYGALYYPWIKVGDPLGGGSIMVPPSGYMSGVYARSDAERGVHKAPANEVVRGAVGVEMQITKGEQDILNPVGINCIRAFPGRGIRIWGARTLSSDASWRYINVRRLFAWVEESIQQGTQWIVFEPNDPTLWGKIRRDVNAFLTMVWRTGALFGATPDQAFYVKCDEENNPPAARDLGQVVIEIGMAPVKPAEFVIFRISQWAAGAAVGE